MDIKKMMQQAQKMQKKLEEKIRIIDEKEFIHESNGIKVRMLGSLQLKDIEVSDDLMDDKDMLQDIIIVVINEVIKKIEKEKADVYGEVQKGMKGGGGPF